MQHPLVLTTRCTETKKSMHQKGTSNHQTDNWFRKLISKTHSNTCLKCKGHAKNENMMTRIRSPYYHGNCINGLT